MRNSLFLISSFVAAAMGQSACQVKVIDATNSLVAEMGTQITACQAGSGFTFVPATRAPTPAEATKLCAIPACQEILAAAKTKLVGLEDCAVGGSTVDEHFNHFDMHCSSGEPPLPGTKGPKCTQKAAYRN